MQYTRLGKSDLLVSRICMGCMGFGDPSTGQHSWTLDETASRDIIRYGLEKGINFYDTAIAYQNGSSERYVGRALREMAKRDDIVLATKFLPRTPAQIAGGISGKEAIAQSLDQSLKNLGMDYIDLYIYHIWDYNTPIIDVLEALHTAVTAGKVRAVGISNCYAWQLAKANALAEREGLTPFVSVQSHYNLIMREDERELFGLCTEDNIAMTPYSALASGRLSRKEGYTRRATEDDYARGKYDSTAEQDRSIIERVAETGRTPSGVNDGNISRLAADKSHITCRRGYKKSSCRWRGKRSKSSTKSGGNSVSGRNLPAACSDGDHGAKYAANERC